MSGSVNRVVLIGHLGHDPSLRRDEADRPVASFSLATNEVWKDSRGQRQEETTWHQIVVFGDLAEACARYLAKGRSCYVEGRLALRQWTAKDGQDKSRTEIIAQKVVFLGGADAPRAAPATSAPRPRSAGTHRQERYPAREPGAPLPGDEGTGF